MFNLNKLVAGTSIALAAMTAATAFGANSELEDAVSWGHENELTQYSTVDTFMPYNTLTREQGAKFFSAFATLNLCKEPDETADCDFSDLDTADQTLADYAVLACQLGLFKGSNGKFMPKAPFMKNEVITVLVRALDGMMDEDVSPRWKNYFMAAKEAGLTNEVSATALARPVQRYEALLMMYRAKSDECTKDSTDLEDLLNGLFGTGTLPGTTVTTGVVTTPSVGTVTSNGTLKCMLSSSTPAGATVPAGVSIKVATYECTAVGEAVTLDNLSFARQGIADNSSVSSLSVFANDNLVSKGRSFNSDATQFASLSPKVTIAAGATVKLDVVAKLGAVANNQRVKIALTDFASNGNNDKSMLPAVSNQFEIVTVTPAKVTVKAVGSVPNVKLGEKAVKVGKFDIRNDSSDNTDVTINQITIRDDNGNISKDLANLVLWNRGTKIGMVATPGNKSVTFVLSSPILIKRGQTETFDLTADIIYGAGDVINLVIDNDIYVLGSDSRYGYGIAVDTSLYGSQAFTITAGKVTLTKLNNPVRKIRANKRDVVLANFNLVNNAGSDNLSLENIKFVSNLAVSSPTYFQNVKMKVTNVNGSSSTYNLDTATNWLSYSAKDLGVYLPASTGNVNIQLIADVANTLPAGTPATPATSTSVTNVGTAVGTSGMTTTTLMSSGANGATISTVRVTTIGAGGTGTYTETITTNTPAIPASSAAASFYYTLMYNGLDSSFLKIIENNTNKAVSDIVPSSITFDTISFVNPNLGISPRSLSAAINVVKGTANVEAIRFDLLTDEVSPVRIETILVGGNTEFNSNRVSKVALYRGTYPNGVLVKDYSSFGSVGNTMTLDGLNLEIPAKSTQPMYVTIDTVSTTGAGINLFISSVTAKDAENNDTVPVTVLPANSNRYISTVSAGLLTYSINTTDNKTNKAKVVVGGTESSEVAAFELNLTNDGALLKDIELTVSGVSFNDAVNEIMLYSATGAVVDSHAEFISANTVQFNNIGTALPVGTTKFFVKVLAKSIGLNKDASTEPSLPFAIKVNSVTVEWYSDASQVAYTAGSNYSNDFTFRAVKVSNVSLATAGSSLPASSALSKVASVTFAADSSSNTSVGGFDLKAKIAALKLNFGGVIAGSLSGVELRNNAGIVVATCNPAGACTAVSPWALVDQGGTNTFYVWVSTNSATYTVNNNDTLTVGISNTDTDVSVVASDTNGVDQYGTQVGLFLPSITSVTAITITE